MAYGSVKVDSIITSTATHSVDGFAPKASPTFTTDIELASQAPLKFFDIHGHGYVAFRTPSFVGTSVKWTLNNADGSSGSFLSTNGSGTLSWATPAAGASVGLAIALG